MNEQITGALFKRMVLHGAAVITAQKQAINDLNVFPVPDGDTGTNMSMTIGTAVTELRKSEPATVEQAASVTASALLRGARGNSGVILSLLFRGLSKALKGRETADAAAFAAAMQEGVSAAYKAVMKPAEGTVLTVSRLAAKQAVDTAAAGETDLERVLEDAIRVGYAALAQTTEMNPVLKKAGVVDAGGKGYLLILDGMLAELRGEPMPETEAGESREEKADFAAMAAEDITFAFDTVFIVRKAMADISLEPLRTYLNSIGDSLVIGEDDEAFKVHVHTNIPGNALNEAQKYGTLELAKIENMRGGAGEALRLSGGVRRGRPGRRVPGPGGRRCGVRWADHEPLHREYSGGREQDPGGDGVRPAQQRQHHHGRPAVRRPDGEAGGGDPHQDRAPGHHRHDERGFRRAGCPDHY